LEAAVILVRNLFRVKFGQAKPAVAAFQEVRAAMKQSGLKSRLLTDLVGPSYTLIHEIEFENLSAFEQEMKKITGSAEWRARYEKFMPFCEAGSREVFNIVAE
jgi:hypothetical protein